MASISQNFRQNEPLWLTLTSLDCCAASGWRIALPARSNASVPLHVGISCSKRCADDYGLPPFALVGWLLVLILPFGNARHSATGTPHQLERDERTYRGRSSSDTMVTSGGVSLLGLRASGAPEPRNAFERRWLRVSKWTINSRRHMISNVIRTKQLIA